MSMEKIPNELVEIIIGCLSNEPDLFHAAQTSRLFCAIALPHLYRRNQENDVRGGGISYRAASRGWVDTLNRAAMCGISMDNPRLALNAVQGRSLEAFEFLAANRTYEFSHDELLALVEKACRSPNFDILNMLFDDLGATIDHRHPWRCLTEATWANSTRCVQFLLDKGADPTFASDVRTDYTPLEIAAMEDYADIANILLSHGATGIRTDVTPLHLAAVHGNMHVLRVLLNYNTDASIETMSRDTALRFAIRHGHEDAAVLILQQSSTHAADERTLRSAVSQGYAEVVRLHLEAGVDILQGDESLWLPFDPPKFSLLYSAASFGSSPIVRLLLDAGANTEIGNPDGESPLFVAVEKENLQVVDLLLSRGANPNPTGRTGLTPMHLAAQRGNLSIMTTLMSYGVGTEMETSHDKVTPLHLAFAGINGINTVRFLLQRGHRVEIKARGNGISCLHMATLFDQFNTVCWLLNNPAGAELLNTSDHAGRTALFIAAREGHGGIVKELIARKADLRKPDHFGSMPIFAAVRNNKLHVTKVLLDADPGLLQSRDKIYGGHSLFDWAQICRDNAHIYFLTRRAKDAGIDLPQYGMAPYTWPAPPRLDERRHPCDICTRRFPFRMATRCTTCCGGEFYMCSNCKNNAQCLDDSHSIESGDWLVDPPTYIANHYRHRPMWSLR